MVIGYTLYHGDKLKADSLNFKWLRNDAMQFHKSKWQDDVFILPHAA